MSLSIRLHHPDHAPYWLVGSPLVPESERTYVSTETWQIGRQQQAVGGVAWFSRQHFDRYNQSLSFEATTYLEFQHPWEQLDFIARLAPESEEEQEHQWEGVIYLRDTQGLDWREWPMREATVMLAGTEVVGSVGLRLRYRIQAGGMGPGVTGRIEMGAIGYYSDAEPAVMVVTGVEVNDIVDTYGIVPGDRVELVISRTGLEPVVRSYQITDYDTIPGELGLPLGSALWYVWHTLDLEHPGLITTVETAPQDWTVTTADVGEEALISFRFYRGTGDDEELVHTLETAGSVGAFNHITTPDGDRIVAMIS